jgi:hypothetical protein
MTNQCRLLHDWAKWQMVKDELELPPELIGPWHRALQERVCLRCGRRQAKPIMTVKAFWQVLP